MKLRCHAPGGCLLLLFLLCRLMLPAQQRPNIIFIMADDLGYGDLSCYGSNTIRTPQLDRLAAGGIRFTQAYAGAPLCTPSRAALMTGLYPARTEVGLREPLDEIPADSAVGLRPQEATLTMQLKGQGYSTCLIGKWHLGFTQAFSPRANGFDYFFGYHSGGVDYVRHTSSLGMPDLYENDSPVKVPGYFTHILAEKAVEYIRQPHPRPFFLSLQFSAPHWPWQAPGDPVNPVGDKEFKMFGSKEKYQAMVQSLDSAIGRVLAAVQEAGIGTNTLIVFTSDNGGERYSSMGGLRQRKFTLWEGGIRVPAMVSWPDALAGGRVHTSPIIHMDWTATFLALAGATPRQPMDGINLVPILQGLQQPEARSFYWRVFQRNQQKALRSGPWKYLKTEKAEYLFHLERDPYENNNLRADHAAVFNRLQQQYAAWEKRMLKPVPLPAQ